MKWKSFSHVQLFATPWTCTVHGILQARILKWVAFPFSRGSSQPRDRTQVSHIAGRFFISWATWKAQEYWSGQPIPSPSDLLDLGIKPGSPPQGYCQTHNTWDWTDAFDSNLSHAYSHPGGRKDHVTWVRTVVSLGNRGQERGLWEDPFVVLGGEVSWFPREDIIGLLE